MDASVGFLILAGIIYGIVRLVRSESPPRTTTRPAPPTPPSSSTRHPSAKPQPRDAQAERELRRQTAADASFFEGVLFAHYFLHDRDDPQQQDPWAPEDIHDDAFHDDFGDW